MSADQQIPILSSPNPSLPSKRQQALREMKRVLRHGALDARAALLLSSSVIELEHDPDIDPRGVLALNRSVLLANA